MKEFHNFVADKFVVFLLFFFYFIYFFFGANLQQI